MSFPGSSVVKSLPADTGVAGSIPGMGISLEEAMATHFSVLVWKIPWTEEPSGLQSLGSGCKESGTTEQTQLHICEGGGLPGGASSKEPACQCRTHKRRGFDPWIEKIPWRRAHQPTPVFLPGIPWTEEPGGYGP